MHSSSARSSGFSLASIPRAKLLRLIPSRRCVTSRQFQSEPQMTKHARTAESQRRVGLASHKSFIIVGSRAIPIVISFLFGCSAIAVSPHLASITPTGAQRGTEIEVSFNGDRLQDAQEIICYEPGLQIVKLSLVTNKVVQAQVKLAPDCNLGRSEENTSELQSHSFISYAV